MKYKRKYCSQCGNKLRKEEYFLSKSDNFPYSESPMWEIKVKEIRKCPYHSNEKFIISIDKKIIHENLLKED